MTDRNQSKDDCRSAGFNGHQLSMFLLPVLAIHYLPGSVTHVNVETVCYAQQISCLTGDSWRAGNWGFLLIGHQHAVLYCFYVP